MLQVIFFAAKDFVGTRNLAERERSFLEPKIFFTAKDLKIRKFSVAKELSTNSKKMKIDDVFIIKTRKLKIHSSENALKTNKVHGYLINLYGLMNAKRGSGLLFLD